MTSHDAHLMLSAIIAHVIAIIVPVIVSMAYDSLEPAQVVMPMATI